MTLPQFTTAVDRANRGGRSARVLFIGDSITAGWTPSGSGTPATDRPSSKLVTLYSADGGSAVHGLRGWSNNAFDIGTSGSNPTRTEWSIGAGWVYTASAFGWGANGLLSAINQTTTTSVGPFTCTGFRIMYLKFSGGSAGAFNVKIDGGSTLTTLDCSGTARVATAIVGAGSLGSHTLNIQAVTGKTGWIYAVEPIVDAAVLSVGHAGVSTSTTANWASTTNPTANAMSCIDAANADLFVLLLGTNDQSANVSQATYAANLSTVVARCVASGADVLLCYPPVNTMANQDKATLYRASIDTIIAGYGDGVELVDLHALGTGVLAPDGIHLTTAGSEAFAELVKARLDAVANVVDGSSVVLDLSTTPTRPRTLRWDSAAYVPAVLTTDTSAPRVFKGWVDPDDEGVTLAVGDTWVRTAPASAPDIILDTDASTDVDDAFDIKAAMVYHNEGMANIIGIACTTSNAYSPGAARGMGNYYGISAVPVASYAPLGSFDPGTPRDVFHDLYDALPHTGIGLASTVTDTTTAYRTWLANSSGDVRIIMTGFAKALRAALQSSADGISGLNGNDLFAAKVERIYAVAGKYPTDGGTPEFNLEQNAADWDWLTANCPVPITWIGIEIGDAIGVIGDTYLTDRTTSSDPVRIALASWGALTRTPWGVVGVHYAIEGAAKYQFQTVTGTNAINSSTGANTFTAGTGTQEYVTTAHAARLKEHHNSMIAADARTGSYTWNGTAWV